MYTHPQPPHDNLSQYDQQFALPQNFTLMRLDRAMNSSSHTNGEQESWANSKLFKIDNGKPKEATPSREYEIDLNKFEAFRKPQQRISENWLAAEQNAKKIKKDIGFFEEKRTSAKDDSLVKVLEHSHWDGPQKSGWDKDINDISADFMELNQHNKAPMLLLDESSVCPSDPSPQLQVFNNPFFIPPVQPPPQSKQIFMDFTRGDPVSTALHPLSLPKSPLQQNRQTNTNLSSYYKDTVRINYFSTLQKDNIPRLFYCERCNMVGETSGHYQLCKGGDFVLREIPIGDVDRAIAHVDAKLEDLYTQMHLLACNYLQSHIGTMAVVETSILKLTLDIIASCRIDELETYIKELEFNKSTIQQSSSNLSQAEHSLLAIINAFIFWSKDKYSRLHSLPPRIRSLLIQIKQVDMQTNQKLEELKLWKTRCTSMSQYNASPKSLPTAQDFHRESFIKRLIELKVLVNCRENPSRYVLADKEYDEIMHKNFDYQSALEYMLQQYLNA